MSDDPPVRKPGPASSSGVRASDEDREKLADELREHAVAGRLEIDELEDRLQAAYAARTTTELDALRRDLPPSTRQVALRHRARRSHLTRRMIQETGGSAGAFVVATGVWLASGAHGQFWPVWILLVVLLTVGRTAWALFGPAPDLDAVEAQLEARRQQRLNHSGRHDRHRQRHIDRDDRRNQRGR
jgi:hypothetical protein